MKDCFVINSLFQVHPKVDQRRMAIMFLLHFFFKEINSYNVNFDLHNFLFNIGQIVQFSLSEFSCTEIGNFPDRYMYLNQVCNFYTPRYATFQTVLYLVIRATFLMILCLLTSYIIFTPRKASSQLFMLLNEI